MRLPASSNSMVLPVADSGELAVRDAVPMGLVLRLRVTTTPELLSISAFTPLVEVDGVPDIFKFPVVSTVSVESLSALLFPAPSSTTCSDAESCADSSLSNLSNVSFILFPLSDAIVLLLPNKDTHMPKSTVSRKKKFREFSKIDKRYITENGMKNLHFLYLDAKATMDLGKAEVDILFFIYDLEFWTIAYLSQAMDKSHKKLADRYVYPLMKKGWIYKHFDKLTPSQNMEDHFFRDETKMNYRVRYALTQKGRLNVARLYRKMRGEESFNVS